MILMQNDVKEFKNNNLIKGYPDDFGYDIRAGEDGMISPRCSSGFIFTGLHVYMPPVLGAKIEARSNQLNVDVMADGTIDSGWQGTVGVKLYNSMPYQWKKGDKIAQMVFHVRPEGMFGLYGCRPRLFSIQEKPISEWPASARGENWCGSSGVK